MIHKQICTISVDVVEKTWLDTEEKKSPITTYSLLML